MMLKPIVIIPTYNESRNVVELASYIFGIVPGATILFVDDNSPDGTAAKIVEAQTKLPDLRVYKREGIKGFGRSYIDGFKMVINDERYDCIVMMDADFSHDPVAVPPMLNKLDVNDVVIGSRYVSGGSISNWNFKRRMLSRFANVYARTILGIPVRDLTTGFICIKKGVLENIDFGSIRSDGYAFLIELKYKLYKAGYKMTEYPIIFSERREGQSKMSTKIIWESIWLPWRLRLRKK